MLRRTRQQISLGLTSDEPKPTASKNDAKPAKPGLTSSALAYLASLRNTSKTIQIEKTEGKIHENVIKRETPKTEQEKIPEEPKIESKLSLDLSELISTPTNLDTSVAFSPHIDRKTPSPKRDESYSSSIGSVLDQIKSIDDLEIATEISEPKIQKSEEIQDQNTIISEDDAFEKIVSIPSLEEIETEQSEKSSVSIPTVKSLTPPASYRSDFEVESDSEPESKSIAETVPDEPISEQFETVTETSSVSASSSSSKISSKGRKTSPKFRELAVQTDERLAVDRPTFSTLHPSILEQICIENYHEVMDVRRPLQMALHSLLYSHLQTLKNFSESQRRLYQEWNSHFEESARNSILKNGVEKL